jgi:hypothetical protein
MARAALERHGGRPELDRMASRLGLPQAAILLTLEYLQALAQLRVSHDDQGLRVEQPDRATESADSQPSDAQDQDTHAGTLREPLARALAETRAYRQAWIVLPPEALLATPDG